MTSPKRPSLQRTALLAAPLLVALSLSACGSSDSTATTGASASPSSTSSTDTSSTSGSPSSSASPTAGAADAAFCTAAASITTIGQGIATDDTAAQVSAAHQYAQTLQDAGTPEDMTDDEAAGLAAYTKFFAEVDEAEAKKLGADNASLDDSDVFGSDLSKVQALEKYITTNCAAAFISAAPSAGTVAPTDGAS